MRFCRYSVKVCRQGTVQETDPSNVQLAYASETEIDPANMAANKVLAVSLLDRVIALQSPREQHRIAQSQRGATQGVNGSSLGRYSVRWERDLSGCPLPFRAETSRLLLVLSGTALNVPQRLFKHRSRGSWHRYPAFWPPRSLTHPSPHSTFLVIACSVHLRLSFHCRSNDARA